MSGADITTILRRTANPTCGLTRRAAGVIEHLREELNTARAERDAARNDFARRIGSDEEFHAMYQRAWNLSDVDGVGGSFTLLTGLAFDRLEAQLTEARRVLLAQDECMVCKAELFRDLTVPHCFDCVVDDDHAEEWDAICAAKAAVLAQEEK